MRVINALLVVLAAGCTLYKHGSDTTDASICNAPTGGGAEPADPIRDPSTGQCIDVGPPCVPQCGPCPAVVTIEGPNCFGPCENLDEAACLTTATCHAAYTGSGSGSGSDNPVFMACWDTTPLVPQTGVDCTTLDALSCAAQDDCISLLSAAGNLPTFTACAPEAPLDESCRAATCNPGDRCVVGCDATTCTPACIAEGPSTPGTCDGIVACSDPAPACPTGTSAGIANGCFTGYCIPASGCNDPKPGACTTASCNSAPPACPAGSTPSVTNGCWDGYCIPAGACP